MDNDREMAKGNLKTHIIVWMGQCLELRARRGKLCCRGGTSTHTAAGGRVNAGRAGSNRLLLLTFSSSSSFVLQLLRDRVAPELPALAEGDSHIRLGKYRASS